jgi:glycosyltransferase involved in cell wall biosynthesis
MAEPLTILHTEGSRHWGGQESRVLDECCWMRGRGHRAVIAGPAESVLARKAAALGLEHRPIPFARSGFPADVLRVRRLLRHLRPQVLNTHGNLDSKVSLVAALGLGIPLVIRSRHSIPPVRRTFWNLLLYRRLCHAVLTTADCASQQLIRDLGLAADRVFTIPSGIRLPGALPTRASARQQLEREASIPVGGRLIGYVGRLHRAKGLPDLLAAFRRLADRIDACHLVLVGEGPDLDVLRHQAARLRLGDRVHFPGYRDDPWPFYRALDCHVLASPEHEGISQSLRQAMFAECPVVATDTGGSAEVVRPGETGILVPAGNPVRLAEALEQVLSDPIASAERARRARAFVEAHHTQDQMGRALLGIYERFLSGGQRRT